MGRVLEAIEKDGIVRLSRCIIQRTFRSVLNRQCAYYVTLLSVSVTIVAVEMLYYMS